MVEKIDREGRELLVKGSERTRNSWLYIDQRTINRLYRSIMGYESEEMEGN